MLPALSKDDKITARKIQDQITNLQTRPLMIMHVYDRIWKDMQNEFYWSEFVTLTTKNNVLQKVIIQVATLGFCFIMII